MHSSDAPPRSRRRAFAITIVIASVGCGGAITSERSGGHDRADAGAADGSGGPADAGAQHPDAADAAQCVDIDLGTYDRACAADSDCFSATSGHFCAGEPLCTCGGFAINVDGKARYDAQLADVQAVAHGPNVCSCPYFGQPRCLRGVCTLCGGAAGECPDGG